MAQIAMSSLVENPLFRTYGFYCSILALKMLLMSTLTAMKRLKHKVFINPEDTVIHKVKVKVDENVERVRRAHLNDLENILVFFIVSFVYILTDPAPSFATMLFRIYTIARIVHTIVYAVFVLPQPARGLSWVIGYGITIYMAFKSLVFFM